MSDSNPNTTLRELLGHSDETKAILINSEAIRALIGRVVTCEETTSKLLQRISKLEEVLLAGGITYRPEGYDQHLNMKGNYDEIYKRLRNLESGTVTRDIEH
jgi:hypothetical protein